MAGDQPERGGRGKLRHIADPRNSFFVDASAFVRMMLSMKVTEALRNSRIAAGLTQKRVAEMLCVTPQFISDIEQGRRALGEKYLAMLPHEMRSTVCAAMVDEHQLAIYRIGSAFLGSSS